MMPYQDDDDRDPVRYSGPATVLTGLPRTIRRHELRLIVPLADSTIYEMEKRGEFPRRLRLDASCGIWKRSRHGCSNAAKPAWNDERRSRLARMFTSARPDRSEQ
jgi:hypothetical protein